MGLTRNVWPMMFTITVGQGVQDRECGNKHSDLAHCTRLRHPFGVLRVVCGARLRLLALGTTLSKSISTFLREKRFNVTQPILSPEICLQCLRVSS